MNIIIMKWFSCFLIFWCCQIAVTINPFVTATHSDVESLSDGDIDHDDDDDSPNVISIPVGLNGDTKVVIFRLAIEDNGYRELMLSNFCKLHDLSYESYLVLMRQLDHQCSSYELWNRRNDTQDVHYDRGIKSFPVNVTDYQNHNRTIHFTLNVSDALHHESSQSPSPSPPLSLSSTAASAFFSFTRQ
jgi:hypothetical protein